MQYDFPKITRQRIKTVNAESKIIGDGTTADPTEEERAWLDIIVSTAPELEVRKKKLYVCALADIVDYNADAVSVKYDGVMYTIKKPTNSLQIARALERSVVDALEALAAQACIYVGAVPVMRDFSGVPVEAVQVLSKVAENFFFMPYL